MSSTPSSRALCRLIVFAALTVFRPMLVFAQQPPTFRDERVTVAAVVDVRNAYMLRGVRQDDTGTITSPAVEAGVRLHTSHHGLTTAQLHVGTWNSLHTGWAGSDGPAGNRWYESDVYTTVSLGFGNAVALDTTFTSYRSPNDMFTTVKELAVRATADRPMPGGAALKPYALTAFELDTKSGVGQLDGGFKAGRYLELGATPSHSIRRIGVAVPVRVGLSLGNYYELAGTDHRFGFVSVGGIATLPVTRWWNVHGGVELQRLGTTTKAFNNGESSKTIASIGVGFTR